jgi:hypothetical protein
MRCRRESLRWEGATKVHDEIESKVNYPTLRPKAAEG